MANYVYGIELNTIQNCRNKRIQEEITIFLNNTQSICIGDNNDPLAIY